MAKIKWLILYSKEQNQFRIEDDSKRNYILTSNGYRVMSVNESYEQVLDKLNMFNKVRIEHPEVINKLFDFVGEMEENFKSLIRPQAKQ